VDVSAGTTPLTVTDTLMAFSAVNVEKFGGLNLVSDPQEIGLEQASSLAQRGVGPQRPAPDP
jgi:hypothetical protein